MNRLPFALLVATLALAPTTTEAATAIWIGPENGSWSDPANWSTGAVPGIGDAVIIDDDPSQSTTVQAGSGTQSNSLQIDQLDRLYLTSAPFTSTFTEISGQLELSSETSFLAAGVLNVSPTGQLTVNAGSSLRSLNGGATFWWNEGLIGGAGILNSNHNFLNEGTISANVATKPLDIRTTWSGDVSIVENSGTLQAVDGGILRVSTSGVSAVLRQTGEEARIVAAPNSFVSLEKVRIKGGTLASLSDETGTGHFDLIGAFLDRVRLEGTIKATNTTLEGAIHNLGKLQVSQAVTVARTTVDLSGDGVLELDGISAIGAAPILKFPTVGSSSPALLRNLGNTIRGRGRINLFGGVLENHATIETGFGDMQPPDATSSGLLFDQGKITNTGTIRANANDAVSFSAAYIVNDIETGVIEAMPGGTIELASGEIIGGVLRAVPSDNSEVPHGVFRFSSNGSILTDVRLEGMVGSSTSQAGIRGRIEVEDTFEVRNLTVLGPTEIIGGEVHVTGGSLRGNIPGSASPLSLTLIDTTLRLSSTSPYGGTVQLINNGTILASGSNDFNSELPLINSGLIHAQAGSGLSLPVVQTALGAPNAELRLDEGARIGVPALIGGKVISAQGTEATPYSGHVEILGNTLGSSLEDVTNFGLIRVQRGRIAGEITNDGLIEFRSNTVYQGSAALHLTGTGELHLLGRTLEGSATSPGATLVNDSRHTISSYGTLAYNTQTLVNRGTIEADSGYLYAKTDSGGNFVQQGTLRAQGDSTLVVALSQPRLDNNGLFDIHLTGSLYVTGTQQINNRSESEVEVNGTIYSAAANITNYAGATIRGGGIIVGAGDTAQNQSILTNHGLVAPGSTVGDLQIRGNFVQSATGVLEIDVTGFETGEFDQLIIETISASSGGNATLAGTLDFNFSPELLPALGDELVVLTAKQITGVFDTIEGLPTLAAGLDWQIDYLPTMVMATVIGLTPPNLAGDFNADGFVNLADYTVWRDGLGDTHAASDYDQWKLNFGRSIHDLTPEVTAPAAVPEPTTALLALAFLPLVVRRARR